MNSLLFIIRKSIKNYIKTYKAKIATIGIIFIAFAFLMLFTSTSSSGISEQSIGSDQFIGYATLFIISMFLLLLYNGIRDGASFFRIADINFVFTAPISHQRVLAYGFIKEFLNNIAIGFFLLFQIPNLQRIFPLKVYGGIICILVILLITLSQSIITMSIYPFIAEDNKKKSILTNIIYLVAAFLGILLISKYIKGNNISSSIEIVFNNDFINYIPIIGNLKGIVHASVYGISISTIVHFVILIAYVSIFILILSRSKNDYYEEVIQKTELKEEAIKFKRKGGGVNDITSRTKVRKVTGHYKSFGARAIYEKHLLEMKKTGYFFIDKGSLVTLGVVILFTILSKETNIWATLSMSMYMLFLLSFSGRWSQEMDRPYIYLIPEKAMSKVWYSTLINHYKNLLDGLIIFIAAGYMYKSNILEIVFCVVAYVLVGAILLYSDLLKRRILGEVGSKFIGVLFNFLILIIVIVIGVAIIVPLVIFLNTSNIIIFIAITMYLFVVSLTLMFLSKGLFEQLES